MRIKWILWNIRRFSFPKRPKPGMKSGETVRVCYDGKWARGADGKVMRNLFFVLLVEFVPYASEDNHTEKMWARLTKKGYYGGYLKGDDKLMRMLFGLPGDWYSVYPEERIE